MKPVICLAVLYRILGSPCHGAPPVTVSKTGLRPVLAERPHPFEARVPKHLRRQDLGSHRRVVTAVQSVAASALQSQTVTGGLLEPLAETDLLAEFRSAGA